MAAGQAGPADWTTYHRGNDRHGVDTNSPTAGRLKAQWGAWLDGPVFTQPLVYQGLVVVATQQDSVFAFEDVKAAFARLAQGPMGKVLVRVAG